MSIRAVSPDTTPSDADILVAKGQESEPVWQEMQARGRLAAWPLTFLTHSNSTNDLAIDWLGGKQHSCDLAEALASLPRTADGGLVLVAGRQSKGRGRLGRDWYSPAAGGIYLSRLYWTRLASEALPRLTLAVGLAVALSIEKSYGINCRIKWPNDIIIAGRKCGGVLCECPPVVAASRAVAERQAVVVGIGLNINSEINAFPAQLQEKAGSLLFIDRIYRDRGVLLATLLGELDVIVSRMEAGDFPQILAEWRNRDALLGKPVKWHTAKDELVEGIALSPDEQGLLRIKDQQGRVRTVLSGELHQV